MAVLGSNGVGWKVSSFTKSLFGGGCGAASLALRPVNVSQLVWVSAGLELKFHWESQRKHIHSHIEDVVLCRYKEKIRGCARSLPRPVTHGVCG